jgi:glycine/D-amino acid oxidase-like deaminating enzyme
MHYPLPVRADVIVVGGGIVGAACALECTAAGLSVVVVDRGAVAAGTTGAGEGNILVSDKEPGPELELALLSNVRWLRIVEELERDVELERKGGLVVAPTTSVLAPLTAFGQGQARAGVRCEPVDESGLREHEPHLRDGLPGGAFYPQDMQVQPMLATAAMLEAARRAGARVLAHTEVLGIRRTRSGAVAGVTTSSCRIDAPYVVNAAGTWGGAVAELAGSTLPVRPRRGFILVTAPAPLLVRRKVYNASYVADVASGDSSLQSSAVIEGTRSGTILVGATREIVGFDGRLSMPALRRLAAAAVELFPVLAGLHVMRTYQGFRPFMPDHLPVIGEDVTVPGLVHACGHEGAGIGLATGTSQLVADVVLGRESPIDRRPFSPARFQVAAATGVLA